MKLQEAQKAIEEMGVEEIQRSLRSWRESVGLNQLDLAKLSGVPQSNIHRIEDGKQGVTPRTFARVMTAIEKARQKRISELEKENSILRGVQEAASYVALCSTLPWMKSQLPLAKTRLAEKKEEAAKLSDTDSLSDPIVRGLLDSLYREIEILGDATSIYGQLAGGAAMNAIDAFQRGDQWAVEAYEHWKATGEAPAVKIDHIEKVEQGDK